MAGLLDIFGTSGADTMGLLGMSQGDISRNRDDAQAQALYALAGRLFQGGNTGASIAQGLQQGQQAYKQAMQGNVQEQLQNVQLMDMIRKRKQEQAALAEQQRVQGVIQGAVTKPQEIYGEDMMGQRVGEGMTAPRFDLQRAMPQLIGSPEGRKTLGELIAAQKAMAGETFKLGEGEKQYQRDTFTGQVKEVASGAQKQITLKEVDLGSHVALLDPRTGAQVARFPKGRAPEGPASLQFVETEQGIATFNPKTGDIKPFMQDGQQLKGKNTGQLTESQGNAVAYGMRMSEANQILTPLENAGLKDTGMLRAGVSGTLGAVPLIGDALAKGSDNVFNSLPSILGGLSENQQKVVQARTNFITAVLRKESGASISPSEYATAEKIYFPAPGDSKTVIEQKQQARDTAIRAMKLQAGKGSEFIGKGSTTSSGW